MEKAHAEKVTEIEKLWQKRIDAMERKIVATTSNQENQLQDWVKKLNRFYINEKKEVDDYVKRENPQCFGGDHPVGAQYSRMRLSLIEKLVKHMIDYKDE
jgi:hypothetical protein